MRMNLELIQRACLRISDNLSARELSENSDKVIDVPYGVVSWLVAELNRIDSILGWGRTYDPILDKLLSELHEEVVKHLESNGKVDENDHYISNSTEKD